MSLGKNHRDICAHDLADIQLKKNELRTNYEEIFFALVNKKH